MARRRRSGGKWRPGAATCNPPIAIVPSERRSIPARQRSSVVLPDPEGPSSTRKVPGSTWRCTPARAEVVPKCFEAPAMSTLAPVSGATGGEETAVSSNCLPPPHAPPTCGGEAAERSEHEGDHREVRQKCHHGHSRPDVVVIVGKPVVDSH